MKHFKFQQNTAIYYPFLSLASLLFSAGIVLLAGRALAQNAVLRSIFSCQAQGLSGVMPSLTVSYQQGTNLSFLPAGETIKKVWLNDPSQVTVDFDGPVCTQFGQNQNFSGDCKNSAANVIQLRRIPKLKIPGLPANLNKTLLTVITEGQGKTKLYTFEVRYTDSDPGYHTLAIYTDPPSVNGRPPCVKG